MLSGAQMRLLQHDGDLVCGMDFHVDVRENWDRHWRNIPAAEIMPYGPHGPQLGVRLPLHHMHIIVAPGIMKPWFKRTGPEIPTHFMSTRGAAPLVMYQLCKTMVK